jgi:hypothetical protein
MIKTLNLSDKFKTIAEFSKHSNGEYIVVKITSPFEFQFQFNSKCFGIYVAFENDFTESVLKGMTTEECVAMVCYIQTSIALIDIGFIHKSGNQFQKNGKYVSFNVRPYHTKKAMIDLKDCNENKIYSYKDDDISSLQKHAEKISNPNYFSESNADEFLKQLGFELND